MVFIGIITGFLSLVIVIGNLLVFIFFKVNIEFKIVNNYFLLSLVCVDFIIGIFFMNFYIIYLFMGYWVLGTLVCDFWLVLDYVVSNVFVMNLLFISFDRYFFVIRFLSYRVKRILRRVVLMIGLAWLVFFVLWVLVIFFW